MTLDEILAVADAAYPDGLVAAAADDMDVGDTLAEFIFRELQDTYDAGASDEQQLAEAVRVMATAREELEAVEEALREVAGP